MSIQNDNLLNNEGEFQYKGHSFYILYPNSTKTIEQLTEYEVILIFASHPEFASFTIRKLRGYKDPQMYLKPIYFLKPSNDSNNYLNTISDGTIYNLSQLDALIPSIEEILTTNSKVYINNTISYESELIMKMLSFNFTRGRKQINPIPYMLSAINFCYPGLSSSFGYTEENKVFEILDLAESEGLISSSFYDKTHYCSKCNNGALYYRSVCPKCSSSNSETEDIVHHFRCGYVGPISDYKNEIDDSLFCPKCNKNLRHIGVDYDKPSALHTCNSCSNKFQDFEVKAKCMNCEYDNEIEYLIEKEIKKYTITNKGESAILYGYVAMQKEIEEIIGTVKFELFNKMTKFEIERMKYSKHQSFVALLNLKNTNELITKVGRSHQRELIKDIIMTVRNSIKPFDIISFRSLSTFVFSINEENEETALKTVYELSNLLNFLITDNVPDFDAKFEFDFLVLNTHEHYKKQLDRLIQNYE
ncbi:MAG: hypothetical protein LW701_08325 [Fluviicola sp.]|jgi:hypothetical protein|nr:hypothetical protein [Fluviicola sp.]